MTEPNGFLSIEKPTYGVGINRLPQFIEHPNWPIAASLAIEQVILALHNENEEWDSETIEHVATAIAEAGFPRWLWEYVDTDDQTMSDEEINEIARLMCAGQMTEAYNLFQPIAMWLSEENCALAHELILARCFHHNKET